MDYESIKKHAKAVSEQVLTVRRTIHSRPELSFEEHETADYIAAQLTEAGILFRRIAGRASKGTATCNAAWCSGPTRTRCRSGRKPDSNAPPGTTE